MRNIEKFVSLWRDVTISNIASRKRHLGSTMAPATVPHAFWTQDDEDQLIDFLLDHRAAAGDRGNFKEVTFQALSALLTPLVTKGGPKTVRACQNKWNAVRWFFVLYCDIF
jgi:hypothetical protein